MKKIFPFIIIFLLIFFVVALLKISSKPNPTNNIVNLISITPQSEFSAWIPYWEDKSMIDSLTASSKKLHYLSPVWYEINPVGKIVEIDNNQKNEINNLASASGILILPTISNQSNRSRFLSLISNNEETAFQIENLIKIAIKQKYSGWDLDFEQLKSEDTQDFSGFVKTLSSELHKNNLMLSVTVHSQYDINTQSNDSYSQDWKELSSDADFIRIMAYDFSNKSTGPGPITPLDILNSVLHYAILNIPKNKIVIGLPTYGYDWSDKNTTPIQYTDAIQKIDKYFGNINRDNISKELIGRYSANKISHEIWFEDKKSIIEKIELARSVGVYRFCFWRLGGEDLSLWN